MRISTRRAIVTEYLHNMKEDAIDDLRKAHADDDGGTVIAIATAIKSIQDVIDIIEMPEAIKRIADEFIGELKEAQRMLRNTP